MSYFTVDVREEDIKKLKDVEELKELVLPKLKEAKVANKFDVVGGAEKKEVKSRQEPPNPVPDEPKVPPKKKKTVLVPPLIKGDDDKLKTKIDIEDIKKSMEKLDLPKSVEVEKVEAKDPKSIREEIIKINNTINIIKALNRSSGLISKDGDNNNNEIVKKSPMAESIANGVPLPLAIKGKLDTKKNKMVDDAKGREKRDTLVETEIDKAENGSRENINLTASNIVIENATSGTAARDKTGESFVKEIEKDKSESKNDQCLKNIALQAARVKGDPVNTDSPLKNDSGMRNAKDVTSNLDVEKSTVKSTILQGSIEGRDLIKTPSYLSDPSLVLDSERILHGAETKLNVESVPLKRDLKSVPEPLNRDKIEHR